MTQTLTCDWNSKLQPELEEKLQVHLLLRKQEKLSIPVQLHPIIYT